MPAGVTYRPLTRSDLAAARLLMIEVFNRFNAGGYTRQGRESFYSFISLNHLMQGLDQGWICYGAYRQEELIGVLLMSTPNHISELFVGADYQKQGIGSELMRLGEAQARKDPRFFGQISVNASEYARRFYLKHGFTDIAPLRTQDGIRYQPMCKICR